MPPTHAHLTPYFTAIGNRLLLPSNLNKQEKRSVHLCAVPVSFVIGVQLCDVFFFFFFFFFFFWGGGGDERSERIQIPLKAVHNKPASDDGPTLNAGLVAL